MTTPTMLYWYAVKPLRVVDGDTLDLEFDYGFTVKQRHRVRLADINAPEMRGQERQLGIAARDHLIELVNRAERHQARTHKDESDSFGRYIVALMGWIDGQWVSLNELMVRDGHAVWKDYRETPYNELESDSRKL